MTSTVGVKTAEPPSIVLDYLVVGAGGGAGNDVGGGGGSGGVVVGTTLKVYLPISLTISIGLGGSSSAGDPKGGDGGNSNIVFSGGTVTAYGGGGGGSNSATPSTRPGASGGSGGGGGSWGASYAGGTSTQTNFSSLNGVGYGFAGGTNFTGQFGSGGGGGAGGAGTTGTGAFVAGGLPISSAISGSSINYAGGGYGNSDSGVIYPTGRDSSNTYIGLYGFGGNGTGSPNQSPYSGAQGIVIIRYPGAIQLATGGTVTSSGGYQIHTYTSNGTFVI